MDIITGTKLRDNLKVRCIKSVTIKNWYSLKCDKGKEYIKRRVYRCNNSNNKIINIYRVFTKSRYPLRTEFNEKSFKKYFKLIENKEKYMTQINIKTLARELEKY